MSTKLPKEKLITFCQTACGEDWQEAYHDLCYILGPLYWGHDYSL